MKTDTYKLNLAGLSPSSASTKSNHPGKSPAVDTLGHFMCANDSARFKQLLELAREGNEASIWDLWQEFAFEFKPTHA